MSASCFFNFRLWLPFLLGLNWLYFLPSEAQAQIWHTAITASQGNISSAIKATTVDADGNVYIVGTFFGAVVLGDITLIGSGNRDLFVAKWNPISRRYSWVRAAGGINDDKVTGIAVSGNNVYITGSFQGTTATFGTKSVSNPNGYQEEIFVAKLTDQGENTDFQWVKTAGGAGADQATSLVANGSSIYVAGSFQCPSASFGNISLSGSGVSDDIFVAKLIDNGSTADFIWAYQAGGNLNDRATAVSVVDSNIYLAGNFNSTTASFSDHILTNSDVSNGGQDMFVAKLIDTGNSAQFGWAKKAGGPRAESLTAMAVSGNHIYITGSFSGFTPLFGDFNLYGSTSYNDMFVAKLTDLGANASFIWANQASGSCPSTALAVSGNSVYIAGGFLYTANFGTSNLVNNHLYYYPTSDAYVVKLIDAGTTSRYAWLQKAGGPGNDSASGLAVCGNNMYLVGTFSSIAMFGNLTASTVSPSDVSFLAGLTDNTILSTSKQQLTRVELYPNPAHVTTTIQMPAIPNATAVTFTLVDVSGRVVRMSSMDKLAIDLKYELDLAGVASGLYALHIQVGEAYTTRLLTVE